MTGGASNTRLAALLQLAIVLVISVSLVQGQTIGFAGCQNYQSSPNFNADYVAKLATETGGYSMLLTSDRPRTSGCQQITFNSNGTLFISYQNDYTEMRNFTSIYTVVETTVTEAGYVEIEVPGGALGTGLSGNIKLYFIMAEDDYFVVATCESLILLPVSIELVHAFIPSSELGVTTSDILNSTLVATGKLADVGSLREVNQACAATLRLVGGPPTIAQIYNFLVKIGVLDPLPFMSDQGGQAQFYSGFPTSLPYPSYMYPALSYRAPVQSIAYGQAPVSQPFQAVRQTPSNFYNAPPATSGYPGLTYQSQQPSYVPEVAYKFQSPKVNDYSPAFGSQQPGVTFISGIPYYIQDQGRENFDTSAFGSQQPGVNYMSGAPFTSQQSRMDYDSSPFNVQSPDVGRDSSAFNSQSPGIIYDSSAFNIQSSVVSQDPSVFDSQSTGIISEPSPFTAQN